MRFWKCEVRDDNGNILKYCVGDRIEDHNGKELFTGIRYNGWKFTPIKLR